jgi:excisionase family DNA binding protein
MCEQDPDRLMDVEEAAALLGMKPGTLYSWASKRRVPFRKVGAALRFHRGELLEWTKEQAQAGRQSAPRASKLRVIK